MALTYSNTAKISRRDERESGFLMHTSIDVVFHIENIETL